jgi:hypothetical protein
MVRSAAERFRRGCATDRRACIGGGARGGVDVIAMSFGREIGDVDVLRHPWIKQEGGVRSRR